MKGGKIVDNTNGRCMDTSDRSGNGINKKKMRKLLYIYLIIILVLIFSSRTIYNVSLPRVTAAMPKSGWLTKGIEARGVVEFAETIDIFAISDGWIDEIFVSAGTVVDENTIIAQYSPASVLSDEAIAELGFAVERVENQLAQLRINQQAIQRKLQTLGVLSYDDMIQYRWAIDDATTTLERLQAELDEAQQLIEFTNNGQTPQQDGTQADTIALRDWNRLVAELQSAQAELLGLESESEVFDDFIYQQNIVEASVTLERRIADLQAAETALEKVIDAPRATFDNFTYQQAINTARAAHERSVQDFDDALNRRDIAMDSFVSAAYWGVFDWLTMAQATLQEAEDNLSQFRSIRNEANNNLNHAIELMRRAENAFDSQAAEAREQAVSNAERNLTQARHAFEDATRTYENAVNTLSRVRGAARDSAITDAQTRVEEALAELDNNAWNSRLDMRAVESRLLDAHNNLTRAEDIHEMAQNAQASQINDTRTTLESELQRVNVDIDQVNIDLRAAQLSYNTALNNGAINIMASHHGQVISIEKRSGQFISRGDIIATVGIGSGEFTLELMANTSEASFIELGDTASIYIGGSSVGIPATIYNITPIHDALNIRLIIETEQLNGGEYVRVRIHKQTGPHNTLIPNSAVFPGAMGQYYVWTIRSRFGPLGTEYYAVRQNVLIADSDDFYTAISRGLEMVGMPVITGYSQDLSINGRVRRME